MTFPSVNDSAGSTIAVPSDEPTLRRGWALAALYAVLAAIAIYPVMSVTVPPLVDYPNHLARMHILSAWDSDSDLQKNYAVNWALGPNRAMDILLPPLARVFDVYDVGRVFVAMALLSLVAGTAALRKVVVGRVGLWPMLAFLLLYNHAVFWGFLNFTFTAGLALLGFSAWIALRDRSPGVRLSVFAIVAVILFYGHLFGLLIYGLLVLGYELAWTWQRRKEGFPFAAWAVSAGQFVVPFALFLEWVGRNDSTGDAINRFGSWINKVVALISPVHFGLPAIDFPTAVFLGGAVILCITRRWVRIAEPLRIPVILLAAAAALMPNFLSGVWGTDFRLPAIVGCVLLAGVQTAPGALKPVRAIMAVAMALFLVRTAMIADHWHGLDANFQEFRGATKSIERGSKLLVVEDKDDLPEGVAPLTEMSYWHMGALAVIERGAFYPTLFTGHTTVDASAATAAIDSPVGTPVTRGNLVGTADASKSAYPLGHRLSRYVWLFWIGWPETFDYVLTIRFDNRTNPYSGRLEPVKTGSYFDIYRVVPGGDGETK